MLVEVLVEGGTGQSFLISKRLLDIFPAPGHGVPALTEASSSGGGLLSEVGGCLFCGFTRALSWGGCMVVLPEFGLATALSFLVGLNLFLFSAVLDSFLIWGLVSGRGGLNWLVWD